MVNSFGNKEIVLTRSEEIVLAQVGVVEEKKQQGVLDLSKSITTPKVEDSPTLEKHSVKKRQEPSSFKTFLQRHFGPVFGFLSDKEKETVKNINEFIKALEVSIDLSEEDGAEFDKLTRKSGFVTDATLTKTKTDIRYAKNDYQAAEAFLFDLQSYKETATELGHKYARFSELPEKIVSLENKMKHFKSRIEVTEELLKYETKLSTYNLDKTWENYKELRKASGSLGTQIKTILADDPTIKHQPQIQKILQKSGSLSSVQINDLMEKVHPCLVHQTQRALDGLVTAQKDQALRLEKKISEVESKIATYNVQSKEINKLEQQIFNPSISNRVSLFIHGEDSIKNKLRIAKKKLKDIFSGVNKLNNFAPDELTWLQEVSKKDKKYIPLTKRSNNIEMEIDRLTSREVFVGKMNKLLTTFTDFNQSSKLLSDQKDAEMFDATANTEAHLKELRENIKIGFSDLATNIELVSKGFVKTNQLPRKFDRMKPLDQLAASIKVNYPQTNQIADGIATFIKTRKMENEINTVIEAVWNHKSEETLPKKQEEVVQEEIDLTLPPSYDPPPPPPSDEVSNTPPPLPPREEIYEGSIQPVSELESKKEDYSLLVDDEVPVKNEDAIPESVILEEQEKTNDTTAIPSFIPTPPSSPKLKTSPPPTPATPSAPPAPPNRIPDFINKAPVPDISILEKIKNRGQELKHVEKNVVTIENTSRNNPKVKPPEEDNSLVGVFARAMKDRRARLEPKDETQKPKDATPVLKNTEVSENEWDAA